VGLVLIEKLEYIQELINQLDKIYKLCNNEYFLIDKKYWNCYISKEFLMINIFAIFFFNISVIFFY
jgi:hypothetical protein